MYIYISERTYFQNRMGLKDYRAVQSLEMLKIYHFKWIWLCMVLFPQSCMFDTMRISACYLIGECVYACVCLCGRGMNEERVCVLRWDVRGGALSACGNKYSRCRVSLCTIPWCDKQSSTGTWEPLACLIHVSCLICLIDITWRKLVISPSSSAAEIESSYATRDEV